MIEETYKFKWKTFEEEMPESYKIILARSPKETIKNAQCSRHRYRRMPLPVPRKNDKEAASVHTTTWVKWHLLLVMLLRCGHNRPLRCG